MKMPYPAQGGPKERAASRHNDTPTFQAQVAQVWSGLGGSHYTLCWVPWLRGGGEPVGAGADVGQGLATQEVPGPKGGGVGSSFPLRPWLFVLGYLAPASVQAAVGNLIHFNCQEFLLGGFSFLIRW